MASPLQAGPGSSRRPERVHASCVFPCLNMLSEDVCSNGCRKLGEGDGNSLGKRPSMTLGPAAAGLQKEGQPPRGSNSQSK